MWRLRLVQWLVASAAVAGLTLLYWPALTTGFLNDDYLFIEDALRPGWTESITALVGPMGNYFRPLSRGLYFELLLPVLGLHPFGYHLFNFALFLGALVLLADLLRVFLPRAGVMVGLLYFATLPLHGVNLRWISCSQDLLALLFVLAAVALFRRGRIALSAVCYLGAVFSKESALPLPLLLFLWPAASPGPNDWRARLSRVWPLGAVSLVWIAVTLWVRAGGRGMPLSLGPSKITAAYVHQLQSLLGLDHPAGMLESFVRHGPVPLALVALAPLALLLRSAAVQTVDTPAVLAAPHDAARPPLWKFAGMWLLGFGFVTAPAAHTWSSYYYTLAAVGAALAAGHLARRIGPAGWLALCGLLLWWNAAGTGIRAFAVVDHPWQWTSHLTSFYFQRAAALTDTLERQLQSLVPAPAPHTRFFFAYLPSWAGFQMGNGAQVRILYRDPTLESYFLSQFSESTAAENPCRFLGWNGQRFAELYPTESDELFQIGSDLLVLGRPAGARHAFRRGLLAGEDPIDHYYWLGWSELWLGRRRAAEEAWRRFGATDDSARWFIRMRLARMALIDRGDSLEARRQLIAAIRSGIGRPEAHAVLGKLLLERRPKYGLLELQVAAYLKPNDWLARRDLALGLMGQQLEARAREELAALLPVYPGWERDSAVVRARETLDRSARATGPLVQF